MIIFSSGLIDESVQVASNKCCLIGYSLYSDDASGAELKIFDGTDNSGTLVGHLVVGEDGFQTYALPAMGLRCPNGLYAEITGDGEALVYYNR
jgi:hypothetical protein